MISIFFSQIVCLFFMIRNYFYPPQARFPLLKLDDVAIREVLNSLDPIDYINFSKASKACRILSTVKTSCKVILIFMDFPVFCIYNSTNSDCFIWTGDKEKDGTRKIGTWENKSREVFYKYSENSLNAMQEFKELYVYVRSLMGVEIDYVVLKMDKLGGRCSEIVAWFRSIRQEVSDLTIYGTNQPQEEMQYLLDNLKFKNSSIICLDTIGDLPLEIPNKIEGVRITYGSWITFDYVMRLEISRMAFNSTYLTNQDINMFYKSWMKMQSHQNLEFFEINLMNPEDFVAVCLRDISYEIIPPIPEPLPNYTPMEGSFEVTRIDGLKAYFGVYDGPDPQGIVACMFTWLDKDVVEITLNLKELN
ncbi:hypothetical protein B9Z55_004846 [Caenorhabditis nigoni]|uniref:F-box domain-containing protein n=2 Tax=Caenorhabditis nigoni TaxID=1611254 RepID=A0A2G5UYB3_9PELO|nr:hypothetical protein B9Z55_004846 [Caenorhabditis nigoni]